MLDPAPAAALSRRRLESANLVHAQRNRSRFLPGRRIRPRGQREAPARHAASMASSSSAVPKAHTLLSQAARRDGSNPFRFKPSTPWPPATASTAHSPWRCLKASKRKNLILGRCAIRRCAAAISVTRRGAQASMPTRAEVDTFLAERGENLLHPHSAYQMAAIRRRRPNVQKHSLRQPRNFSQQSPLPPQRRIRICAVGQQIPGPTCNLFFMPPSMYFSLAALPFAHEHWLRRLAALARRAPHSHRLRPVPLRDAGVPAGHSPASCSRR